SDLDRKRPWLRYVRQLNSAETHGSSRAPWGTRCSPPRTSRTLRKRSRSCVPRQAAIGKILSRGISSAWSMARSEEHTSELQSRENLVCRLLLEQNKRS